MTRVGLIITAAGKSERFGRPKLLDTLRDQPVIAWTIQSFLEFPFAQKILTVAPELHDQFATIVHAIDPAFQLVVGDSTRAASVHAGFCALSDIDYVFIHDAARPFVPRTTLDHLLSTLEYAEVVIPVVPVTDTIKRVTPQGIVERTLDRSTLVHVQTPQAFRHTTLRRAYEQALQRGSLLHTGITDEALLCEYIGVYAHTIPGDPISHKITFPTDLRVL